MSTINANHFASKFSEIVQQIFEPRIIDYSPRTIYLSVYLQFIVTFSHH